jgi:helicase
MGKPEEILSKLAVEPVLRMYTLSLIAASYFNSREQMLRFFEKTFFCFQFEDMSKIELLLGKVTGLLESWKFITSSGRDFTAADQLGRDSFSATILGRRVAELYIDPLTANHLVECLKCSAKPSSFALFQMVANTIEMRPLLSVRQREMDSVQEQLLKSALLEQEPSVYEPEYDDFLNSIKTAMFFNDWADEKDEEYLLEAYNVRPGELKVKIDNADWLLYAAGEIARILKQHGMIREIAKLRMRLKYGAREELLPLLQLKEIGRVRARALFRNGIKDIADVKKADIATLSQILGRQTALNIKLQVGEPLPDVVPESKRTGQLALGRFGEGLGQT